MVSIPDYGSCTYVMPDLPRSQTIEIRTQRTTEGESGRDVLRLSSFSFLGPSRFVTSHSRFAPALFATKVRNEAPEEQADARLFQATSLFKSAGGE